MREAPWTRLVRELKDTGYESPYLDRLRARLDPAEAVARLETEIVQEMAQALGRTEDKLNYALLRLELAARAIDTAPDELVRYDRVKEFNARQWYCLNSASMSTATAFCAVRPR